MSPRKRRNVRVAFTVAAILAGSLGLAFLIRGGPSAGTAGASARSAAISVRTITLAPESYRGTVSAGGFLRAVHEATVSSERPGRVVALPLEEGAAVARGECVAVLDDVEARAALDEARAAAREAALDPQRPADEVARARARLVTATHELALLHPVSPLRGVIDARHVEVGETVAAGTPLVDVVDPDLLRLDVEVDPEIVSRIDRAAPVEIQATGLGEAGRAKGRIFRVVLRADTRTRRYRVEIDLDSKHGVFFPGMHAEARFPLPAAAPALYLPKEALRRRGEENGVFLVEGGRARFREISVESAPLRPGFWRIVGGAPPKGARVVVAGFPGLRDGSPVEVSP